jgi:hypothetical protein
MLTLKNIVESRTHEDRQMIDYYKHQLDLLAQMCQDQQYLAIDPPPERKLLNISSELPVKLVLKYVFWGDTGLIKKFCLDACQTRDCLVILELLLHV